ncbi:hypothetical protein SDC9_102496 [bioreactor metagenome]|uniref:Uncharacterized protein n=1 Tax=bioreactor metagenome TaxID=1076179 RepID=A0A645ARL2_9ZZZZ
MARTAGQRRAPSRHRPLGARSGRGRAVAAGGQRQELAVAQRRRSACRHPALGCAGRRAQDIAGRCIGQLPGACEGRVGRSACRCAAGLAGGGADRARIVRRRRSRAHAGGRAAGGPAACASAGGAQGGLPRLAGAAGRAARRAAQGQPPGAGGGRGRRHHRPHADPRGAGRCTRRTAHTHPHRRGRAFDARRRQHGPGAGPSAGVAVRRSGRTAPARCALCTTGAALPRRQDSVAGRRCAAIRLGNAVGQRLATDGANALGHALARRGARVDRGRFSAAGGPHRHARQTPGGAARLWSAVSGGCGHLAASGAVSGAARGGRVAGHSAAQRGRVPCPCAGRTAHRAVGRMARRTGACAAQPAPRLGRGAWCCGLWAHACRSAGCGAHAQHTPHARCCRCCPAAHWRRCCAQLLAGAARQARHRNARPVPAAAWHARGHAHHPHRPTLCTAARPGRAVRAGIQQPQRPAISGGPVGHAGRRCMAASARACHRAAGVRYIVHHSHIRRGAVAGLHDRGRHAGNALHCGR